jgi:hypothetical protein
VIGAVGRCWEELQGSKSMSYVGQFQISSKVQPIAAIALALTKSSRQAAGHDIKRAYERAVIAIYCGGAAFF